MKIWSLLFIAFLSLQFISFAQEGWFDQASGTIEKLSSIYFIDDNNGFIVDDSKKVLHTTNCGVSFVEEQSSGLYEIEYSAIGGSAFDGDYYSLSSGIYIYQLRVGNLEQTKKWC